MRTGLTIICILAIMGGALVLALPVANAQTGSDAYITFHVVNYGNYSPKEVETVPEDSPETIVITGTDDTGTAAVLDFRLMLDSICSLTAPIGTGTPTVAPSPTPTGTVTPATCAQVDIYYKVQFSINWNSGYEDNCGGWGYCSRDLPPSVTYSHGGSSNVTTETFDCGVLAQHGSCSHKDSGVILASDITNSMLNSTIYWNEKFYILMNDLDHGVGGTTSMNYTIILSTSPIHADCSGQYNIGGMLGTFTLAATNSAGQNLQTLLGTSYPAPGQWYVVAVNSGYWQNNGSGPQLKDLAMKTGSAGTWYPLTSGPTTGCEDSDNATYYLQMASTAAVYLRVYDTDGNFAANTGSLSISISSVTAYDVYPDGCELQYQVGNLIEQRVVMADNYIGQPLKSDLPPSPGGNATATQPDRYYMLETIGGPAILPDVLGATIYSWDADLGQRDNAADVTPSIWHEATAAPFVVCSRQIDVVGHVRVYFPAERQAQILGAISRYYYSFRVRKEGGTYAGNTGSLGYRLYEATNMQMTAPGETPTTNGCSFYSHGTTPASSVVIAATDADGMQLPILTSHVLYALEVTDGPWYDGGSSASYSIELSDDDGLTWSDLGSYPNLLCSATADGDHVVIYIYGASGKVWRARVNDQDSNFGSNTGSIGLDVFVGTTSINEYPECASGYNLTKVPLTDEQRRIPGNMEAGTAVPASSLLGASMTYSIEITDENKWYEAGAGNGSYLVDISDDGGSTWTALEDYTVLCKEALGDTGDRFQIYFNSYSHNFKLRVRDGDSNFLSNTGFVMYNLYKAVDNNAPGGSDNPAPPEWVVACSESYSRPSEFIKRYPFDWGIVSGTIPLPMVGEWIDYLRSAIVYYFAWCPQHTNMLKSVGDVAMNKEPMASFTSMLDFVKSIQTLLQTSQASGGLDGSVVTSQEPDLFGDTATIGQGTGGGSGTDVPASHGAGIWDLFVVGNFDPSTSFWTTGRIDLTSAAGKPYDGASDAYVDVCATKFNSIFGFFAVPFCGVMGLMRYSNTISWVLLLIDLMVTLWIVIKYVPGWIKRMMELFRSLGGIFHRMG